jgi:cytochrome c biogenesis protein CcmG, thiol:disulfide interchange protein DsbE
LNLSRFGRLALLLSPLLILVALVAVFAMNIDRDPSLVRSVLIDKPAPELVLAPVAGLGLPGLDNSRLEGQVSLVNVFASWCVPCREEHPFLMRLADEVDVQMLGINQKDAPENAAKFLADLGNPYDAVGGDDNGRVSIDWGVYGVPESFVVDANGVITYKHVGPINADSYPQVLAAIEKARAG